MLIYTCSIVTAIMTSHHPQRAVMGQMGSLVEAANRIEIPMKIASR